MECSGLAIGAGASGAALCRLPRASGAGPPSFVPWARGLARTVAFQVTIPLPSGSLDSASHPPPSTFGSVWRCYLVVTSGVGLLPSAKHPVMSKVTPTTVVSLAQNISTAEVGQPCPVLSVAFLVQEESP